MLVWKPSVAQGTHSYSHCLPALCRKLRFKSGPTQLKISNPSYEHSPGSPEFPIQNVRPIGQGVSELWSDIQTNIQTEITTWCIYNNNNWKTTISLRKWWRKFKNETIFFKNDRFSKTCRFVNDS